MTCRTYLAARADTARARTHNDRAAVVRVMRESMREFLALREIAAAAHHRLGLAPGPADDADELARQAAGNLSLLCDMWALPNEDSRRSRYLKH